MTVTQVAEGQGLPAANGQVAEGLSGGVQPVLVTLAAWSVEQDKHGSREHSGTIWVA